MKIERFEVIDRCLFWKEKRVLIVGDLHLGYEDSLNESGISIPRSQIKETLDIFERVFKITGVVKEIILLGDVKHYFPRILKDEFNDFYKLIDFFRKNLGEEGRVIITKGNHDMILEPIIRNYSDVLLKEYYILDNLMFFHGDKLSLRRIGLGFFDEKIGLVVVGHYHPAILLKDDSKSERYKCYLFGISKDFNDKKTIFMPSFFPLIEGSDIFNHQQLNLKELKKSKVFVLGDFNEVYEFSFKELKKISTPTP